MNRNWCCGARTPAQFVRLDSVCVSKIVLPVDPIIAVPKKLLQEWQRLEKSDTESVPLRDALKESSRLL